MSVTRRHLLTSIAAASAIIPIVFIRSGRALMIEPISPAEQLMYCTVRIVGRIGDTKNAKTGTGFFYNFPTEADKFIPVLITNKHVIEDTSAIEFLMHATTIQDGKRPDTNTVINSLQTDWMQHPDPKIDLCGLPIGGVANTMRPFPFFRSLDPSLIRSQSQLEDLNAVEDILMVGYPNGLWDATNNFPLLRRGITASHPGVDFDVGGVGTTVVDVASFPGSSGSPVFIYNTGTFADKKGNTTVGTRVIFLGVLYSGPTYQSDGTIVIRNIPTANVAVPQINMMMNLGYIIKARELAQLGSAIFSRYNIKPPT